MCRKRDTQENQRQILRKGEQRDLDGMLPKGGQPVEVFGTVVNFVKAPKKTVRMCRAMVGITTKFE